MSEYKNNRKRTHTPCGAGSRKVLARYFSLSEIKALLTEMYPWLTFDDEADLWADLQDTTPAEGDRRLVITQEVSRILDALADAIPSEEKR